VAVQDASATRLADKPPKVAFWNDPVKRGYLFQAILFLVVAFLIYEAAANAIENMRKQNIASGFGFWNVTAGFDIGQRLIEYSNTSTYGRAFWVGLLNTLLVASIGIVLATFLGAPVEELARAENRDGLCRADPQHAFAAAIALLV
jgi:general L-amino acid transport system permease protein